MDDPVRSIPSWVEFPLDRVFSCWGDFAQDKVPYAKLSELHSFVVVFSHLLLVLRHLVNGFLSYFI